MPDFEQQMQELVRGSDEVLPQDGLQAKLKQSRALQWFAVSQPFAYFYRTIDDLGGKSVVLSVDF